jgi:sulfonate transport system permease protein
MCDANARETKTRMSRKSRDLFRLALPTTNRSASLALGYPRPIKVPFSPHSFAWIVPILLIVAWQSACSLGLAPSELLPSPAAVVMAGFRLTFSGELVANMTASLLRALAGLIIGGGIGLVLGFANGLSKISDAMTDSTVQMIRNIPHLAMTPLVILWFGIDEGAKLFLVAIGVFFPIYINTLHGLRSIDPQFVEMARNYGMTRRDQFWLLILPGASPSIFVGLRYALGIMWLTLIVAETIGAQSGLGYMAMQAREFMQVDVVVLSILIYAVLGKLADSITRFFERKCLAWHPAFRKREPT